MPLFLVVFAIQLTTHPQSLSSLLFCYIAVLHVFFFYFKLLVTHFLHNYFATLFSHFPFDFSCKIRELNKHSIFTYLTHEQILQELLQFKHCSNNCNCNSYKFSYPLLLSSFCSFLQTKNKNLVFSKLVVW